MVSSRGVRPGPLARFRLGAPSLVSGGVVVIVVVSVDVVLRSMSERRKVGPVRGYAISPRSAPFRLSLMRPSGRRWCQMDSACAV